MDLQCMISAEIKEIYGYHITHRFSIVDFGRLTIMAEST